MLTVRARPVMDPRWQKIEEAVCTAAEMPPGDRSAWLDKFCDGDQALRAEIDSLLEAAPSVDAFLEHSVAPYAGTLLQDEVAAPTMVGQYRILHEIGRGGMGVVYLAEREDEFRQLVAIKLVKRGLDTEEILQRFRNERQILASLNHPNIAKLFDGGMTEDGLPYFVMEYIEGKPLTKYSEQNNLSISDRLNLFRLACAAVQHAHQNLVIHRDLKPSNILVTGKREVKLLDFGVAKFLSADADGDATMTQAAQRVMTPQYASPEQIRGQRVTTATDVYSLGVVLYELLTGAKPYKIKDQSAQELSRAICETEPTKPSEAKSELPASESGSHSHCAHDGNHPYAHAGGSDRALRGDLDNIILMALRKDPERRYKSVEQFSEDIRRHLEGLPVIARKDTFQYRASKFIARNSVAVIAAAIVLVAIIGAAIVSTWQARVAAKERNQAQQEQAKAEQVNKFLQSILSAANPEEKGKDARVIEVMQDAAQRIQTELGNQPAVKAQALESIGEAYAKLGMLNEAEPNLREAFQINSSLYGGVSHATTQSASYLAVILANKGNLKDAEPLVTTAIDHERKISSTGSKELAFGLFVLGEIEVRRGDFKKAVTLLRESVTMSDRLGGMNNEDAAFARVSLGRAEQGSGDLVAAESTFRESIAAYRQLPPRYAGRLATALLNLGLLLTTKGSFDEGIGTLVEGQDILKQFGGESYLFFESNNYLCTAYVNHGDYSKAAEACAQGIEVGRKIKLEDTPDFILAADYFGLALARSGRAKEAEPLLRESLERAKKIFPAGDIRTLLIEGAVGECLTAQGGFSEAEPLVIHSYEAIKTSQGEKSALTALAAKRAVTLYEKMKKPTEAAKYRPASGT